MPASPTKGKFSALAVRAFMMRPTRTIISWLNRVQPPQPFPLSDFGRLSQEAKPCDIVLVEGRSRISQVIKAVTQSPWSHAALYIGRLYDIEDPDARRLVQEAAGLPASEQLVIESLLGRGTLVRPLSTYQQDHLRLCRPHGLSGRDAQQVLAYATAQIGKAYDMRQVFDLLRFLLPWSLLPRRWRSTLFRQHPGEPTKTVCSTLIAEAFGAVQFPILPLVQRDEGDEVKLFRRNPKLCTPSDFDYSPYFQIIKYPFMDFSAHTSYRLLPWSTTAPEMVLAEGYLPSGGADAGAEEAGAASPTLSASSSRAAN